MEHVRTVPDEVVFGGANGPGLARSWTATDSGPTADGQWKFNLEAEIQSKFQVAA